MKVLVLGHMGMLGSMVVKYLQCKPAAGDIEVCVSNTQWPENKQEIVAFNGDYIVNCIGAIPQKTDNFDINWQLPIWLDLNAPCKIIHPGTDADDNTSYGISKHVALKYIMYNSNQTKIIQTSIIGPEIQSNSNLLEWFLQHPPNSIVNGYVDVVWCGMTTLEWSKQCVNIMHNWDNHHIVSIFDESRSQLTKYELLETINTVFGKNIKVTKALKSKINNKMILHQLKELKEFYYDK